MVAPAAATPAISITPVRMAVHLRIQAIDLVVDFGQYSDNSLAGLRGIESLQDSPCFKNREFNLTESADGLTSLCQLIQDLRIVES